MLTYLTTMLAKRKKKSSDGTPPEEGKTVQAVNQSAEAPVKPRRRRLKEYRIWAVTRKEDFHSDPHPYSRFRYTVAAKTIRQAYFLARNQIFAQGPKKVGIRKVEFFDREDERMVLVEEAPYLACRQD